jgi:hypothetical protein
MTRLAQDDLFRKDAIELMVRHLEQHAEAGLVYCDEQRIDEAGKVVGLIQRPEPDQIREGGNRFGLCFLWRRSVWEVVGGFDPQFDTAEDFDFLLRVSARFPLTHLAGEAPFFMRLHPEMGSRLFAARQEVLGASILARHCRGVAAARHLARGYFNAGYILKEEGRHGQAFRHLITAIGYWPFDWKPYKSLAGLAWRALRERP